MITTRRLSYGKLVQNFFEYCYGVYHNSFCNYYNMQVVFLNARTVLVQSMSMNYTYVNIKGMMGCTKKTICWFFSCPFNYQIPLNIWLNIPLNIWLSKCHSLLPNVDKIPCLMICFQTLIN